MRNLGVLASLAALPAFAQQLIMSSGNGQLVQEQFVSTSPMIVRAVDASGRPVPNVAVAWSVQPPLSASLREANEVTDSNGFAGAKLVASDLQPGGSFAQSRVTATAASGSVTFIMTTVPRTPGAEPTIEFFLASDLTGRAGSTIPEAFLVRVGAGSGPDRGRGIPNIGVRVALPAEANPATAPGGMCEGTAGIALTDERGLATCNLMLNNNTGLGGLFALIGEARVSRGISLTVTPGEPCNITVGTAAVNFGAGGGGGTLQISAGQGCAWTVTGAPSWITFNGPVSGSVSATVAFTVAANTGAARSATINVSNRTFTVTQNGAGAPGALAITTGQALPSATTGSAYNVSVAAAGGQPPYVWSVTGQLPAGLGLNTATGALGGTITATGTYTFSISVRDAAGATATQAFTLNVTAGGGPSTGPITITTSSFPNGQVGQAYLQPIGVSGGCPNPFAGPPRVEVTGSLPPGLSLQSAAAGGGMTIAGTPTTNGTYNFTVRAKDPCGTEVTRDLSITIGGVSVPPPPPPTPNVTSSVSNIVLSTTTSGGEIPERSFTVATGDVGVSFTASLINSDWLQVTPTSGVTPATLTVRPRVTVLPPGTYTGTVSVATSAPNSPLLVPVTLTVTAVAPTPQITSVVNGASFAQGPVVPGEIITIFGTNLGPATLTTLRLTAAGTIDTTLSDVQVFFDDQPAPLIHVSGTQITVVVPYSMSGRSAARMTVVSGGIRSSVRELAVASSAPGVFTTGGSAQAAALNQDGTVNGTQNGARPGSVISLFATGEGLTTPLSVEGVITSPSALTRPLLPVSVLIGGRSAEVLYAGSAPGQLAGLLQVNVRVPEETPTGSSVPVQVVVGSASSQSGVTIFVRP